MAPFLDGGCQKYQPHDGVGDSSQRCRGPSGSLPRQVQQCLPLCLVCLSCLLCLLCNTVPIGAFSLSLGLFVLCTTPTICGHIFIYPEKEMALSYCSESDWTCENKHLNLFNLFNLHSKVEISAHKQDLPLKLPSFVLNW